MDIPLSPCDPRYSFFRPGSDGKSPHSRLEAIERLLPTLKESLSECSWSSSDQACATSSYHEALQLTHKLPEKGRSALQDRVWSCFLRFLLLSSLPKMVHGRSWEAPSITIRDGQELVELFSLLTSMKVYGEERDAIVERILLRLTMSDDALASPTTLQHLADSFFSQCSLDEKRKRDFALKLAKEGWCGALLFLSRTLPRLELSEKDRLLVAETIARRKDTLWLQRRLLPLELLIEESDHFALSEREWYRFTMQFLDRSPAYAWTTAVQRCKILAHSDRLKLLDRCLEHGCLAIIDSLVCHISAFDLPTKSLQNVAAKIKALNPLLLLINIASFKLSRRRLQEIIFTVEADGSTPALTFLLRSCPIDTTHQYLDRITEESKTVLSRTLIDDCDERQLRDFLERSDHLLPKEEGKRIRLLHRLIERVKHFPHLMRSLIWRIPHLLMSEGHGEKKLKLMMALVNHTESAEWSTFLDKAYIKMLDEENDRFTFALALLNYQKLQENKPSDYIPGLIYFLPTLGLSEEHLLFLLKMIVDKRVDSYTGNLIANFGRFHFSPHSDLNLRLTLAITLMSRVTIEIEAYELSKIHYQFSLPTRNQPHDSTAIGLLSKLDISLESLPHPFPLTFKELFAEEIALVRAAIEKQTACEKERAMVTGQLIALLLYGMEKVNSGDLSEAAIRQGTQLLEELLKYCSPEKCALLYGLMVQQLSEKMMLEKWSSLLTKIENRHILIPALILLPLLLKSPSLELFIIESLQQKKRFFEDGVKKNLLIDFLLRATQGRPLSGDAMVRWLTLIFTDTPTHDPLLYLKKLNDLIDYKELENMADLDSPDALDNCIEELFHHRFQLSAIESFKVKYERSFERFYKKELLLTYADRLQKDPSHFSMLQLYVREVLEGHYPALRYQKGGNPHLQTIFAGRSELEEKWMVGEKSSDCEALLHGNGWTDHFHAITHQIRFLVVDSDDANDLLLYTQCASEHYFATLLDGKNRLIAVKEADGAMRDCCILRLLWDGQKPLLVIQHRLGLINPVIKALMEAMCLKRAKSLGLMLLGYSDNGESFLGKALALGGPLPFEYVYRSDGGTNIITNGIFSLSNLKILWQP